MYELSWIIGESVAGASWSVDLFTAGQECFMCPRAVWSLLT